MTRILSIETSTDETGVSIADVEHTSYGDVRVHFLADTLASQAQLHAAYGGVYPTLAKREHGKNLVPLFRDALAQAQLLEQIPRPEVSKEKLAEIKALLEREPELFVNLAVFLAQTKKPDIDCIAVTYGPGLEPALWVGVNFARALACAWDLPIIPANHMEGHIAAALFERRSGDNFELQIANFELPCLSLLISGGHTELVLSTALGSYARIGKTRDDAAGEAFDKTARLLGLPYPGGPEISKLAQQARERDLEQPYALPRPMLDSGDLDFSFSGLKTAVRNLVAPDEKLSDTQKMQLAREVEEAIADTLVEKTRRAIEAHRVQTLGIGGGVCANTHIRAQFEALAEEMGFELRLPTPDLATDNGRMIALAAALHRDATTSYEDLAADGNLSLDGTSRRGTTAAR